MPGVDMTGAHMPRAHITGAHMPGDAQARGASGHKPIEKALNPTVQAAYPA
jgi:hypothetical protein